MGAAHQKGVVITTLASGRCFSNSQFSPSLSSASTIDKWLRQILVIWGLSEPDPSLQLHSR